MYLHSRTPRNSPCGRKPSSAVTSGPQQETRNPCTTESSRTQTKPTNDDAQSHRFAMMLMELGQALAGRSAGNDASKGKLENQKASCSHHHQSAVITQKTLRSVRPFGSCFGSTYSRHISLHHPHVNLPTPPMRLCRPPVTIVCCALCIVGLCKGKVLCK